MVEGAEEGDSGIRTEASFTHRTCHCGRPADLCRNEPPQPLTHRQVRTAQDQRSSTL